VIQVTDRFAVLRQGRKVADMPTRGVSAQEIVAFITGADGHGAPHAPAQGG
jgi:ABC-type sugar transport system ATPase subunit